MNAVVETVAPVVKTFVETGAKETGKEIAKKAAVIIGSAAGAIGLEHGIKRTVRFIKNKRAAKNNKDAEASEEAA